MRKQDKIDELTLGMERLGSEAEDVQRNIDGFELDESDYEDSYIEMLDMDGTVTAGSLEFYPSRILSEIDPIAYGCGLSDYVDSFDLTESEEYNNLCDELESLETQIVDVEMEIEELENETDTKANVLLAEIESLKAELNDMYGGPGAGIGFISLG